MRFIPIYDGLPQAAVEEEEPQIINKDCRKCSLSGLPDFDIAAVRRAAKRRKLSEEDILALADEAANKKPRVANVCVPPEGEEGGLLIIGDYPDGDSDRVGRPLMSRAGRWARSKIREAWDGPIAVDYAIKCAPRAMVLREPHYRACRGYLHQTIQEVKPKRIITLGSAAMKGTLGRSPNVLSVRRGFGWIANGTIPVFMLINPSYARQNPFVEQWFLNDLEWACNVDVKSLIREVPLDSIIRVIDTVEDARACYDDLSHSEWFSWDVETAGLMFNKDFKVLCTAMAAKDAEDAWVWSKEAMVDPECQTIFKKMMTSTSMGKIPQNGKYDRLAIKAAYSYDVKGNCGDTLYWRKLIDTDADGSLATLQELIGMGGGKGPAKAAELDVVKRCRVKSIGKGKTKREVTTEDLSQIGPLEHVMPIRNGTGRTGAHAMALIDERVLYQYCGRDALSTSRLGTLLGARLDKVPEVKMLWENLMQPASEAIVQVEAWGIKANLDAIKAFHEILDMKKKDIEKRFSVYDTVQKGKVVKFNPGSSQQVSYLLFNKLQLPVLNKTKSGAPSTDAKTLESLRDHHPIVADILDYRLIEKQLGTYAEGMLNHIRADGRIHPSFRIVGTRTGRLSCSEPNLQNITAPYTWYGKLARDIFCVEPGNVMIQVDYSQLELRVAAMLSGDPKMRDIFINGLDYHQKTAELIAPSAWGIRAEDVTKDHRKKAKCFHPDTEVLTPEGWRKIGTVSTDDTIMTCQPGDGFAVKMFWDKPSDVFSARHPDRELVHFKNEGIDIRVTPDHGMLAFTKSGKPQERVLPSDFPSKRYWANAGGFAGSVAVDETLLRLAVATQADGSLEERADGNSIRFGFTKNRKIDRLCGLLDTAGVEFNKSIQGSGVTRIYINAKQSSQILELLDTKSLPWRWLDLEYSLRVAVLDELSHWDVHKATNWKMFAYTSLDTQSLNVAQAIAAVTYAKSRMSGNRLSVKDHHTSRSGNLEVTKLSYDGMVSCLTVPSGCILVRDGGVPLIINQTVNFGLLYGMGDKTLAGNIQSTVKEAASIRKGVLGSFAKYDAWSKEQVANARRTGYTHTYWEGKRARRRALWRIRDQDGGKRNTAENGAANCLDSSTEALTQRGWVKGFDLTKSDVLLTKNIHTGKLEWEKPTDIKLFPNYSGPIVEFKSRSFHAVTTPNHRWMVTDKNSGRVCEKTSANISRHGDHRIHRTGELCGDSNGMPDDFIRLIGWWLTDGYFEKTRKVTGRDGLRGPKPGPPRLVICQSTRANPDKCAEISRVFRSLQIETTERVREMDKQKTWSFKDSYSEQLVELFPDRELTAKFLSTLDRRQAEILMDTMVSGDGYRGSKVSFCSGSKKQAENFQMLATLCGFAASIIKRDMSGHCPQSPLLNNVPKIGDIWYVTLLKRDKVQVMGHQVSEYEGSVGMWCPIVPNTFFVARRSGHVFVTGNTPVQGTASDYCLASLVMCVNWILSSGFPAKLILTVHDSLMFEVPADRAEELVEKVKEIMEGHYNDGVPITVDSDIGLSWGSLFSLEKINGVWCAVWTEKNADGDEIKHHCPWMEKVFPDGVPKK